MSVGNLFCRTAGRTYSEERCVVHIRALSQYQININKSTDLKQITFIEARQAKDVYRYDNITEKIHRRVHKFSLTNCVNHRTSYTYLY
jgi:hypothetical protein